MTVWLALLAGAASGVVGLPRPSVGVVVFGEASVVGPGAVAALARRLQAETSLGLRSVDPRELVGCLGEPTCLYDRSAALDPGQVGLLVLSAFPREDGVELVSAVLLTRVVERVEERPIDAEPRGLAVEDLDPYVESILRVLGGVPELSPRLARPAEVWIRGLRAGDAVWVDGVETLASADGPILRVVDVRPGRRRLEVRSAHAEPFLVELDLAPAGTTDLRVPSDTFLAHPGSTVTALGIAAAGVGLLVAAIAVSASASPDDCFGSRAAPCPGSAGMLRLTFDPDRPGEVGEGPLFAPLGASLVLTGGLWAAGGEWLVEPEETPWLPLVVGLAAGLSLYGIAEAVQVGLGR